MQSKGSSLQNLFTGKILYDPSNQRSQDSSRKPGGISGFRGSLSRKLFDETPKGKLSCPDFDAISPMASPDGGISVHSTSGAEESPLGTSPISFQCLSPAVDDESSRDSGIGEVKRFSAAKKLNFSGLISGDNVDECPVKRRRRINSRTQSINNLQMDILDCTMSEDTMERPALKVVSSNLMDQPEIPSAIKSNLRNPVHFSLDSPYLEDKVTHSAHIQLSGNRKRHANRAPTRTSIFIDEKTDQTVGDKENVRPSPFDSNSYDGVSAKCSEIPNPFRLRSCKPFGENRNNIRDSPDVKLLWKNSKKSNVTSEDELINGQSRTKPMAESSMLARGRSFGGIDNEEAIIGEIRGASIDLPHCDTELVGDFSVSCSLPLIPGRHKDLKSVSPLTVAAVLRSEYTHLIDSVTIVDCRYPYEYNGGHIMGAKNLSNKDEVVEEFFSVNSVPQKSSKSGNGRNIIIFHCEFSSERAPKLLRFLRSHDRSLHCDCYPYLSYPEIYLLDGGYKAFYETCASLCTPEGYTTMLDARFNSELRFFRRKSKSWAGEKKHQVQLSRSHSLRL